MTWLTVLWAVVSGFAQKVGEMIAGRFSKGKRAPKLTVERILQKDMREVKRRLSKAERANVACERKNDRCERKNGVLQGQFNELRSDFKNFLLREQRDRLRRTAQTGGIWLGRFWK